MTDFNFSDKPHIMPIITEIKVKNSDDKELDFNPEELPLLALRNMVLFPVSLCRWLLAEKNR